MTTIEIKDASGKKAGSADLAPSVFGIEPNIHVMHTVVRSQRAAWRQGTHDTKTRGQVRGGGKKPWRQKGTGRARQGTIRAPQWAGGGTVFGPHPRSYETVSYTHLDVYKRQVPCAPRQRHGSDRLHPGHRPQPAGALHGAHPRWSC